MEDCQNCDDLVTSGQSERVTTRSRQHIPIREVTSQAKEVGGNADTKSQAKDFPITRPHAGSL